MKEKIAWFPHIERHQKPPPYSNILYV